MFCNLFDLSYDRDLYEAIVFYFVYFFLSYFFAGLLYNYLDILYGINEFLAITCFILFLFSPLIFYTFISITIVLKKNLKDASSYRLVFYTIIIALFPSICITILLLNSIKNFQLSAIMFGFFWTSEKFLFFSLVFCGIPAAILTTKEDYSLKKEIEQMEREKLEHENWIEEQLLTERAITSKLEVIKKHVNNTKEKEAPNDK